MPLPFRQVSSPVLPRLRGPLSALDISYVWNDGLWVSALCKRTSLGPEDEDVLSSPVCCQWLQHRGQGEALPEPVFSSLCPASLFSERERGCLVQQLNLGESSLETEPPTWRAATSPPSRPAAAFITDVTPRGPRPELPSQGS